MYSNYYPQCPHQKKKKDDFKCFFGKVEQENENAQNATIVQDSTQTNFFIVFCGDKGRWPKIGGFTAANDKGEKVDLAFDEEGNPVINGKTLKGKEIGEGVKMYALRERKVSNKTFGNQPEEVEESVEDYPEADEDFDFEDYEDEWEID